MRDILGLASSAGAWRAGTGLAALALAGGTQPARGQTMPRTPSVPTGTDPGPSPGPAPADADSTISPSRALRFPRDFGAHPGARTEWWYITGWLSLGAGATPPVRTPGSASNAATAAARAAELGFQITFFRTRTGLAEGNRSRFSARQLLFAHAAVSDLRDPRLARLRHDQRIAREGFGLAQAAVDDTDLRLRDWTLSRTTPPGEPEGRKQPPHSVYSVKASSENARFALALSLASTQPVLLQGDAGHSRKGPLVSQASHYYSQPQLATLGRVQIDGRWLDVHGTAWMDHEWSDTLLADDAVGWDWIGMNLFDGRSLTAFQLRRRDGSALWAGGSLRDPAGPLPTAPPTAAGMATRITATQGRSFSPEDLRFTAGRRWVSPLSQASYPVEWTIDTPTGRYRVKALLDAQELDSRASTGALYWEGLSDLLDADGRIVGRGYLEMTGYAARLQL